MKHSKKINSRQSQYTPTWLRNGHGSRKEVSRNVKVKTQNMVTDINLNEISNLGKVKSSFNISSMARKRVESLERNLKAYHGVDVVKTIQKSTCDVENSGENVIFSTKTNDLEMKSEECLYVHTCQTLRAFKGERFILKSNLWR